MFHDFGGMIRGLADGVGGVFVAGAGFTLLVRSIELELMDEEGCTHAQPHFTA